MEKNIDLELDPSARDAILKDLSLIKDRAMEIGDLRLAYDIVMAQSNLRLSRIKLTHFKQ